MMLFFNALDSARNGFQAICRTSPVVFFVCINCKVAEIEFLKLKDAMNAKC